MTPEEILGCSMDSVTRVFPHWHCGTDFTGEKKAQNPASKAPSISNIGFLQNLLYPFHDHDCYPQGGLYYTNSTENLMLES
jgi:hypothetical protein